MPQKLKMIYTVLLHHICVSCGLMVRIVSENSVRPDLRIGFENKQGVQSGNTDISQVRKHPCNLSQDFDPGPVFS